MRFSERWRLAGIILWEARFQGYLDSNPMYRSSIKEKPEKIIRGIRSSVRVNNFLLILIIFIMVVGAIGTGVFAAPESSLEIRLTFSFGVFLLFCFAIIFFLNLLSTIGIFTADLYTLPSIQPLSTQESTSLLMLAFVRMFIWPVLVMAIIYPIGMLIFLGPLAAIVAFLGTISTAFLSIGALIIVSRWFYRKAHSSNQSKSSSIVRILAGLGVALGMVMAYGMTSFLPGIIQFMEQLAANPVTEEIFILIGALFPFSYGLLLSSISNPALVALPEFIVSLSTSVLYSALALLAYRKGGLILRKGITGGFDVSESSAIEPFTFRIQGPIRAMITRDLRLATRNLGTTVIFVFPLLMLIAIAPMLQFSPGIYLRSSILLVAMNYLHVFSGIIILSLIALDTQGSSILEGLPLGSSRIMQAKTALYMPIHILACIVVLVVVLFSTPITPLLLLLPLLQVPVGYAMASFTIALAYRLRGGGRAVAIALTGDAIIMILGMLLSGLLGGLPLFAYGILLLDTGSHLLALIGQGVTSIMLFLLARIISPHLLQD